MSWYDYLITFAINLISGIFVAWIASVFIDDRIKKREQEKSKILRYYLILSNLQNKRICEIADLELNLKEMDLFFSSKKYVKSGIYDKFDNVYRDILSILRYKKDEQLIISDKNTDMQELLVSLKVWL